MHEGHVAGGKRTGFQQLFKGLQPFDDALGVIQPVHTQKHHLRVAKVCPQPCDFVFITRAALGLGARIQRDGEGRNADFAGIEGGDACGDFAQAGSTSGHRMACSAITGVDKLDKVVGI